MKYTIVGDPHAKPDNLDLINKLFDKVESMENPVIWLGDMLDTKEVVRGSCLNTYVKRFSQSKLNHYVLVGNHDWFNLECKEHSLEALKAIKNVTVVDSFFVIHDHDDTKLVLMPYQHDFSALLAKLTEFEKKKPLNIDSHKRALKMDKARAQKTVNREDLILVMHQGFNNFDFGNGFVETNGLNLKDFEGFRLVISGHFHKMQKQDNLIYVGTPFSHSFGESNQSKFIGVLKTREGVVDLEEIFFRKHVTKIVDYSEDEPYDLESVAGGLPEEWPSRIIIRGTEAQMLENHVDAIIPNYPHIKFIKEIQGNTTQLKITEKSSNEEKFLRWATDIAKLDDETVALGKELLKNV